MDLGLDGKRALVTCSSTGLGRACAETLAAEGADLVLFARDADRLRGARESILASADVGVDVLAGDMSRQSSVRKLRDRVAQSGGIDILVLNTPRPPSPMRELLDEDDDARWEQAYRGQLQAALFVLRDLSPLLLDKGWGRIVAITSASVKAPMARHALSTIFRAGVQAALKHLSHELGPHGVTVNAVAPATVVTPSFSTYHDMAQRVQETALKRPGRPSDVADAVAFLASDRAGYLTGQVLQLDGGQTTALV